MHVRKRTALAAAGIAAVAFAVPSLASQGGPGAPGSTACSNSMGTADGTVTWTPTSLWPPNHKMHTVTITYNAPATAADTTAGDVSDVTVTAIFDDQANMDGTGEANGSGAPTDVQGLDWSGIMNSGSAPEGSDATTTVQLRAERSGHFRSGRTYTIMVSCGEQDAGSGMDNPTESGTATLTVTVPHDQGNS